MASPVSVAQFRQELEKLKSEMDSGRLKHGEYDQRLARIIGELRDSKVDADRSGLEAMLNDTLKRGVITTAVKAHIEARLGLSRPSGQA